MGSHRVGDDWSDLAAAAATEKYLQGQAGRKQYEKVTEADFGTNT